MNVEQLGYFYCTYSARPPKLDPPTEIANKRTQMRVDEQKYGIQRQNHRLPIDYRPRAN